MLLTEHKQILPFLESEYEAWGIQKPEGTEMLWKAIDKPNCEVVNIKEDNA